MYFARGQKVIITLAADNPTGLVIFEATLFHNFDDGDSLLYLETRPDKNYRLEILNTASKDFISVAVITKDSVFAENVKLPIDNALLKKLESVEEAAKVNFVADGSKVEAPPDFNPEWKMGDPRDKMGEGREGER